MPNETQWFDYLIENKVIKPPTAPQGLSGRHPGARMPRPPKVPLGSTRTILFREDQIRVLEDAAKGVAVDFSDVIRATIDLLFPLDPASRRIKIRAALELHWHQVVRKSELLCAVVAGWSGKEMTLPLGSAVRRDARLVQQAVDMIHLLELPPPPKGFRSPDDHYLPQDWATTAPDRLLVVLASPATRAASFLGDGRPGVVIASHRILPPGAGSPPDEDPSDARVEAQYEEPAARLSELTRNKEVCDVSATFLGPLQQILPWRVYEIAWGLFGTNPTEPGLVGSGGRTGSRPEREKREKGRR
ncbi:MAG: hypothetical protein JWO38_6903 [Gemmataceae bacterium]|nr:hypothetical protein [Gemmataceae bacterium]